MSTTTTLSPLEIPEILEQILAYVDDDTINDSILLVCKQWYWMTQHRHIREAVWGTRCASTTGDGPSGIESTLPTAHRLYCHLHVGLKSEEQKQIYDRLRMALIHNHNQQIGVPSRRLVEEQAAAAAAATAVQKQQQQTLLDIGEISNMDTRDISIITSTTRTRHRRPRRRHLAPGAPPLHEVVFETCAPLLATHVYPLLPFLYSITSLTIRCTEFSSSDSTFSQLWIPYLMAWCPYLEDLRIDTNKSIMMGGPWFRPPDATRKTPTEPRFKPTRLVSLVLVNVRVKHQDLQDLLEASPWLRDLRVFFTVYHAREEVLFDCEEFVRYARIFFSDNSRQPLEKFHASVKGEPIKDAEMEERMFGLCPTTSDITVQLQDFRPVLLDVFQNRPNVITSLEIVNGDGHPSEVLLRYLCVSPHLLHLKAPRVGIIVEDIGRPSSSRVDTTTASAGSTTTVPKIWACRNIRTLQACFFTRHSFDSQDRGDSGAAVCRWVFGYISRVCSRLRYLDITNIESMEFDGKLSYKGKMFPGCMALESGFCLLARLKEVRWIRLGDGDVSLDVKRVDMSWMLLADETSQTRRVERQKVVSTWTIEQDLGSSESQLNKGDVKENDSLLRQVGTLQDVKAMVDEMNAMESFECWPSLRGITICHHGGCGQDRKHEVDRVLQKAAQPSAVSSPVCSVQPQSNWYSQFFTSPLSLLRGVFSA